ncbi:MAG: hypothetical protein U1D55_06165 [Phycisphaerae bacterium]
MSVPRRLAIVFALFAAGVALAQPHAGDVWIGVSAAGQLKAGGLLDTTNMIVLSASGVGWSNNSPGFDHIISGDAAHDIFPMQSGAQIYFEVINVDPAFRAITSSFEVIDQPGERVFLGDNLLHIHFTWNIWPGDPRFNPQQILWNAQFKLVDTGSTHYADSAPFTMRFTTHVLGDFDHDGDVDESDLGILLSAWQSGPAGDIDGDGDTDEADLGVFLSNWGFGS